MELAVYNQQGQDTGRRVTLNDEVFAIVPSEHALYLDVKQYLANQRQGTHKSKERSEVSGSTRKLHKQKGGGGRVFGPRPRDYRFKLNKKVKQLARRSALTLKAQEGQIIVVDKVEFGTPKTKEYINFAKNLKVDGKKVLLVLDKADENVYLSMRNVPDARLAKASDINTYIVLNNKALILTEQSLETINKL